MTIATRGSLFAIALVLFLAGGAPVEVRSPVALVAVPTAESEAAQTVTVSMNNCFNLCGEVASRLYYNYVDEFNGNNTYAYTLAQRWWRDCVAECDEARESQAELDSSGS